jgi:hypothetical protein
MQSRLPERPEGLFHRKKEREKGLRRKGCLILPGLQDVHNGLHGRRNYPRELIFNTKKAQSGFEKPCHLRYA